MTDDPFNRPRIADDAKERIRQAFLAIPDGKRGALLLLGDTQTKTVRGHLAGHFGKWQVAAGGGVDLTGLVPFVEVGVARYW